MRGTDLKFSTLLLSFKMLISGRERLLMGFGSALEWKMEINGQKRKKNWPDFFGCSRPPEKKLAPCRVPGRLFFFCWSCGTPTRISQKYPGVCLNISWEQKRWKCRPADRAPWWKLSTPDSRCVPDATLFMALDAGQETDNRIKRKMSVWWGSFKEGDTFVKQVHPSLDRFSGDPRTTKLMARWWQLTSDPSNDPSGGRAGAKTADLYLDPGPFIFCYFFTGNFVLLGLKIRGNLYWLIFILLPSLCYSTECWNNCWNVDRTSITKKLMALLHSLWIIYNQFTGIRNVSMWQRRVFAVSRQYLPVSIIWWSKISVFLLVWMKWTGWVCGWPLIAIETLRVKYAQSPGCWAALSHGECPSSSFTALHHLNNQRWLHGPIISWMLSYS